jgi:hypothetical protein
MGDTPDFRVGYSGNNNTKCKAKMLEDVRIDNHDDIFLLG